MSMHVSCLQGLVELNGKALEGFTSSGFCTQGQGGCFVTRMMILSLACGQVLDLLSL